ncbi:MAG TPA: hypothetical protein PKO44_02780 [Candidatus Omnitrophota bacterium]|nr:hypothetical protein [Candidatus Omnitrophota bacterium]
MKKPEQHSARTRSFLQIQQEDFFIKNITPRVSASNAISAFV